MSRVEILQKESYLAMIRNAVGTTLFQNLYATIDDQTKDIVDGGVKSCAYFVSYILHNFRFIATPHATVAGLERDLQASGWHATDTPPQAGDILVWEPLEQAGEVNAHIGFYIGDDTAISNDWQTRVPIQHHMTYGTKLDGTPTRAITAIYTYDSLA